MVVVGIDLSGPSSPQKTAVAVFRSTSGDLELRSLTTCATDEEIVALVPASESIIGIDAPLSYSPRGGSREADIRLRRAAVQAGLPAGAVMAPSAPRMAYLTLRGIALTRLLESERPNAQVVEVHPTVALALRGAPLKAVRTFKKSEESRRRLLQWLEEAGMTGLRERHVASSDHAIAACGAALAARKWRQGEAIWLHPAEPPVHPYDLAC